MWLDIHIEMVQNGWVCLEMTADSWRWWRFMVGDRAGDGDGDGEIARTGQYEVLTRKLIY